MIPAFFLSKAGRTVVIVLVALGVIGGMLANAKKQGRNQAILEAKELDNETAQGIRDRVDDALDGVSDDDITFRD